MNTRKRQSFDPSQFVKKAVVQIEETFVPQHTFADFGFAPQLLSNVEGRGYTNPTPIQDQAIPLLMEGRDIIGLANTGTGKTAAFLLPLINKIFDDRSQRALIVAPTRELAVQIEQEFKLFAQRLNLYSVLCIGGTNIRAQMSKLYRNPEFVVGTPGRLRDLEEQGALDFGTFNNIVFDEVDQMFDMGFIRDVKHITSRLPQPRQAMFFSATLPDSLLRTMDGFQTNPIKISVKSRESAANVEQDIVRTQGQPKIEVLHDLLIKAEFDKVLVFSRTKRATESLARSLGQRGFAVSAIHGNRTQGQRQRAIEQFKRNHIQILVATDVASRGLDIDNVSHVINFDLPETYEDYIHRIGRTGRADKKGIALTFVD
jgi:superfamily II DNA/RNA helicase